MVVSANELYKGLTLLVGNNEVEVLNVWESTGLIRIDYKNPAGRLKSRTYAQTDRVKVIQ